MFAYRAREILGALRKEELCQVLIDFCDARVSIKRIYKECADLGPVYPNPEVGAYYYPVP